MRFTDCAVSGVVDRSSQFCKSDLQVMKRRGKRWNERVDGIVKCCVSFAERDDGWMVKKNGIETKAA